MKYKCTACGSVFDFTQPSRFCPNCGGELESEEKESQKKGVIGDWNVISGGLNASTNNDSHNMINNDSHNVTNNVTNNYVNNAPPSQSQEDRHNEKLNQLRKYFREICPNPNYLSREVRRRLTIKFDDLGLYGVNLEEIILQEQKRYSLEKSQQLEDDERMIIDSIKEMIDRNDIDRLKGIFSYLEDLHEKYNLDEIEFLYYLVGASLVPEKILEEDERDCTYLERFWKIFWCAQYYKSDQSFELQNKVRSWVRTMKDYSENDEVKHLILKCLDNYEKSKQFGERFLKNAIADYEKLLSCELHDYVFDLVRGIGCMLGEMERTDDLKFYLNLLCPSPKVEFVLPRMPKI